jgi:O-antigen ligase
LGWLGISLLSYVNVWQQPAYWRGMANLVLAPLLLYTAARTLALTSAQQRSTWIALWSGGVLVAVVGLLKWSMGQGTDADGILRLAGPHFSPNHTALYLERSLFVGLGLAFGVRRPQRDWVAVATMVMAIALLLTGSRGAWLLGLPAGLVTLGWFKVRIRLRQANSLFNLPRVRVSMAILLIPIILLGVFVFQDRLVNSETILQRFAIWQAALRLWQEYPLLGAGPEGFFWSYPAYLPLQPPLDPNVRHPHNVWLEYAAMGGLSGLLWFGGAIFTFIRAARSDVRRTNEERWRAIGLVAAFAGGFVHAQVDAFGALADLAGWNWLALALYVSANAPDKHIQR